jgi:hypothetical protein
MILNGTILRNHHKSLGKGREKAAELLTSVLNIFDLPQPSYSYKDLSPSAEVLGPDVSGNNQKSYIKKAKIKGQLSKKYFLCEVAARIPTPIYQLKIMREKKQQQKLLLKQNQTNAINGNTNHSSSANGIQEIIQPINGSTTSNSTIIQTKVGEHITVPITFPSPKPAKKGELYDIFGAGESDTRNSARNLAALEVIYQMEQILNVPRGELLDHLRKNADKLLRLSEAHHTIPYNEPLPGITWQNIPPDKSFVAFDRKHAPQHFVPATRVGNIDFMPQIMQNEHALIAAKCITLASQQRLPTLDVHANTMKEGSIQRFANVQPSGGPLEGVVGPLPGGEMNIGLEPNDAIVIGMIYLYNKMTHEPTNKKLKKDVRDRYLAMVNAILKVKDTSYGTAKLFVSLPTHQFNDLRQLLDTIPVYKLPKRHYNVIRRRQPQRRLLRGHNNTKSNTDRERQGRIETFRQHQNLHPLPVDSIENDIPHDVAVTIVRGGTGSGKVGWNLFFFVFFTIYFSLYEFVL